jgi:trypsin
MLLPVVALAAVALPGPAQAGPAAAKGRLCPLIAVPTAAPFGSGTCPGVRPGALVETPIGFCTMNFAFKGPKRVRYIATAGHCAIPEESGGGEQVWARGQGPVAKDAEGEPIGRVAYAVLELDGERDFALIRLNKGLRPTPQMCHFGGPTGVNQDIHRRTTFLNLYGNGAGAGEVLPARQLVAFGLPNPAHVFANGVASPGDSGGPVTSNDGRAVGVLVTGGVHVGSIGTSGVDAGTFGITRLGPQLASARQLLGTRVRLLTAPRG